MRTEIGKYLHNDKIQRLRWRAILLCIILLVVSQSLHYSLEAIFIPILLLAMVIPDKTINDIGKFSAYYTVSFDEEYLYYIAKDIEIKIPLENITAIKLNGPTTTEGINNTIEYKIVYTEDLEAKNIGLKVYNHNRAFNECKRMVQRKNPRVEIITSWPNEIDFTWLDRVTRFINKISEKIFPPKRLP